MTRLQKKCLIAAAGTHFLLVVILLCSGFIKPKPKADDSQVLDVIPDKLIDAAFNSGVRDATPPPPKPPIQTPQPPQLEPPKPVEHVEPPKPVEPVTPPERTQPEDPTPVEHQEPKPPKHEIKVDLTKKVIRNTPTDDSAAAAEKAAKDAKRLRDRARAIERAIKEGSSSSTKVALPGDSQAEYANYASIVKSVYMHAWVPPNDAANDSASVTASIIIANDGHIVSAHITEGSGDPGVDNSVQKTLDRVQQIAPFPEGSTDKERTYPIRFDVSAKRMF